jgi:hypothetical protein
MPLNKSWHDYNESLIERGRVPSGVHILLLTSVSCMNMDSSSTAPVKSVGMREIISLAFL